MRGDLIVAGICLVLIVYAAFWGLLAKIGIMGTFVMYPVLLLLASVGLIMILAGFFTSHSAASRKVDWKPRVRGGQGQGIGAGTAIVVVFVIGLLFVSAFVDLVTCPQCGGSGVTVENTQTEDENICSMCGGDGKVTVLDYIRYRVSEGAEDGG